MKTKKIRILALAMALLTTLTACGQTAEPESSEPVAVLPGEELGIGDAADEVFSLNYNSSASLNPYATDDVNNILISQLVFDNVFELDENYNLTSRIIESYEVSANGMYWTFTIKEGIPMHDGSTLTAYDVAYSISLARRTSRYSGRFICMYGASASDNLTFHISTTKAHTMLPYLLTVPVIKDGSANQTRPVGTGSYMYVEGADYVQAFENYGSTLPVDRVYLKEYTETESIITAFEDSYIDLVLNDTSSTSNLGYGGNTETRYYTTTNMHFFGFNMASPLMSMPNVRYAMSLAVDRDYAADTLMQGSAVASALPISPMSPLYDESVASQLSYNMSLCQQVLTAAGVSDMDNDGQLEYLSYSVMQDAEIDLIVCSQSAGKGDVCNKLADDLASIGFTVNVRELSWADYQAALADMDGDGQPDGDFDMYYAEVKLGADFDLTALLTEDGSMNYGNIADENYATYINNYLAADDLTRQSVCYQMLLYIAQNAPIIPVCFERHEVITHRNVITGIEVTSSNVFYNISEWTIKFSD